MDKKLFTMKPIDNNKLLAWTTRLIALRAAAKGTTTYQEALALKAELLERKLERENRAGQEADYEEAEPETSGDQTEALRAEQRNKERKKGR